MATPTSATTAPASHIDQRSIARARYGVRHLNRRRCGGLSHGRHRRADRQHRTESGGRQYWHCSRHDTLLTSKPSEHSKVHPIWEGQGGSIIIRAHISYILLDCFDQTTVRKDHLQAMKHELRLMTGTSAAQ
jgi:hypothetical protein